MIYVIYDLYVQSSFGHENFRYYEGCEKRHSCK